MDLNNLITTIISSTAALVAIIGGFLVSRVISLSSEQNSIKRKIREIDNDIFAKKELAESIEKYLFEDDLNDFVTKENIIRMFEGKTLEDIIDEVEYTLLSKEELEPFFEQLQDIKNEMSNMVTQKGAEYESFSVFYSELSNIKYPDRKEWYKTVLDAIDELSKQKPKYGIYTADILSSVSKSPDFSPNTDYKDKDKELNRLLDDIRILDLQKDGQLKILDDYGKPKWIWSGLFVLIYASIVGIVFPSTLLPYPKETYDDSLTKWTILGFFFSQLLVLFIYLGLAMRKLTHTEEK